MSACCCVSTNRPPLRAPERLPCPRGVPVRVKLETRVSPAVLLWGTHQGIGALDKRSPIVVMVSSWIDPFFPLILIIWWKGVI